MFLESLKIVNFRCYRFLELEFDSRINVVKGLNGQGKTSILEAVALLGSLKSFRLAKNQEMILHNEQESILEGCTRYGDITTDLRARIVPRVKTATINGKHCKFISQYLGKLSTVAFCPEDLEIIRGGPENRRPWIDRVTSIHFPEHLELCVNYQKALSQRNSLLKAHIEAQTPLGEDFEVWTGQLLHLGSQLIHKRVQTVDKLAPLLTEFYGIISGKPGLLETNYISHMLEGKSGGKTGLFSDISLDSILHSFKEKLQLMHSKEKVLGVTMAGPHKDDLDFLLAGNSLRSFGSQGENRSATLSLRLAEVKSHVMQTGIDPVLLVDDFSSELDQTRKDFLLAYLENSKSQVFLSTTEDLTLGRVFEVREGKVSQYGH